MFLYNHLILLVGLVAFLVPWTFAGSARAETLPDAVRSAIETHPTIEQALAAQEAARQVVRKERAAYFPVISASTAAGRVYGDNATSRGLSTTRGAGYSGLWEGSLSVSQMIFDGFKTARLVEASTAKGQAAEESVVAMRESLALQTALAYLNVLRAVESLGVLTEYQKLLSEYRGKIQQMVADGGADEAEFQQAEIVTLELQNLMANFEGQVQTAQMEYGQLTGHTPRGILDRAIDLSALIPSLDEPALLQMTDAHPQIVAATHEVEAAIQTLSAQKSELYPTLTAELSSYRKDLADLIGGEVDDDRALLRASWDMSTGGAEFAKIDKARHEVDQVKARREEVRRAVAAAIGSAYANLDAVAQQRNVLAVRFDAEQKLLGTYRAQFDAGKVRILQLLQEESRVMNARIELLNAEYRYLAAQYSVLGSLARLQSSLLNLPAAGEGSGG